VVEDVEKTADGGVEETWRWWGRGEERADGWNGEMGEERKFPQSGCSLAMYPKMGGHGCVAGLRYSVL
jgi:hypothetical protein